MAGIFGPRRENKRQKIIGKRGDVQLARGKARMG
jgi:hypothetical protein